MASVPNRRAGGQGPPLPYTELRNEPLFEQAPKINKLWTDKEIKNYETIDDSYNFCNYTWNLRGFRASCKSRRSREYSKNGRSCTEKKLDMWSFSHVVAYYLLSSVTDKNMFLFLFFFSIAYEYVEYLLGYRGRVSDVIINIIAYFIIS